MKTDLTAIQAALADLTDDELHALIAASNNAPPIAYGLLVWIEGACDWELNRRAGRDYDLLPPEAAIDPSEDAVSIDAAIAVLRKYPHYPYYRPSRLSGHALAPEVTLAVAIEYS